MDSSSDLSSLKVTVQPIRQAGGLQTQFGPLNLCKPVDQNSPRLLLAAATLAALTSARIEVFRPQSNTPSLIYTLQDAVFVSGFRFAPSGGDLLCEEIDLDYCKIEVTSLPEHGPPTTIAFDRCSQGSP